MYTIPKQFLFSTQTTIVSTTQVKWLIPYRWLYSYTINMFCSTYSFPPTITQLVLMIGLVHLIHTATVVLYLLYCSLTRSRDRDGKDILEISIFPFRYIDIKNLLPILLYLIIDISSPIYRHMLSTRKLSLQVHFFVN